MTKKEKEKKRDQYKMPYYMATDEQNAHMLYNMTNGIKISFGGIMNRPGKWRIAIHNGEKWVNSPSIYDVDTVYPEFYKFHKYYYDKYAKRSS